MNASDTPTRPEPGILRRLYSLILPYRRTVAAGMLCLVLAVAAELYPPLVWQRVVDYRAGERRLDLYP